MNTLKSKFFATIFLMVIFFDASAESDNSFEFDIGYTRLNYKETDLSNFPTDHLKISITENNFEALVSFGINSSTKNVDGLTYTISAPVIYGIFFKPEINIGYGINLFGKLGLTRSDRKVTSPSNSSSMANGFGYGLGANFLSTKWSKISIEYTDYYNRSGIRLGGFSITNSIKFAY